MKKYIIAETWNGEGFSYQNKVEVKEFETVADVKAHLELLMKGQGDSIDPEDFLGELVPWKIKWDGLSLCYTNGEDDGSFQAIELQPDTYGVIIQTNINNVEQVDLVTWNDRIEAALDQANPEDMEEDPESYELDEDGCMFVSCYEGEYDEQFIKL